MNKSFFDKESGFNLKYKNELFRQVQNRINNSLSYFKISVSQNEDKKKRVEDWLNKFATFFNSFTSIMTGTDYFDDICLFDPNVDLGVASDFLVNDLKLKKNTQRFYIYAGALRTDYYDNIFNYYFGDDNNGSFPKIYNCAHTYEIEGGETNRLYSKLKNFFIYKPQDSSGQGLEKTQAQQDRTDSMFHFLCTDDIFVTHLLHNEHDQLRNVMYIFLDQLLPEQQNRFYQVVDRLFSTDGIARSQI